MLFLAQALWFGPQARAALPVQGLQGPLAPRTEEVPIVVGVEMNGLASYSEKAVLNALGITVGEPLRRLRVERAFEVYGILVTNPTLRAAPGGVEIVMSVAELDQDPDVQFLGVADFTHEKVREWADLGDRSRVYLHEVERIAARIEKGYRKQGYHFVEVQWAYGEPQEDSVIRDVIIKVHEGPKVRSRGVEIRGNHSLPETGQLFWKGGLRKLAKVQTKGKGIFRWFGGVFVEEELMADLQAMRQVYRARGWLDARVEIDGDYIFNKKRNRVLVKVIVEEGPLYKVGSVRLEAYDEKGRELTQKEPSFAESELLALCNLVPGVPLEQARIARDAQELAFFYGDHGYLDAASFDTQGNGDGFYFLEPEITFHEDDQLVDVVYRIVEGRPRTTRRVELRGHTHTRDHVLRREVSVKPGELLSQRELVNSRRRLINTGYFEDPSNPLMRPPNYRLVPVEGDPDLVDVIFEVEEGRNVDLRFTAGVDSNNGLVGIVSLAMRNFELGDTPSGIFSTFGEVYGKEAFHGNGESFSVNLSPGSEVTQWSVDYAHPDFFNSHYDRTGIAVGASGRDRAFRSHDEERNRASLAFSHRFAQGDVSLRVGGIYQNIELDDFSNNDLPTTLVYSPQDSDFHGLNAELRWSDLDNARVPRNGQFFSAGITTYGGFLGGDNDLIKTDIAYDRYWQVGDDSLSVRPGVHLGFRMGVAAPYGDTQLAHYSERYFGGGSRFMRGFRFRGVGPYNGDFALGGETMFGGTAEYRFPIYTTPIAGTSEREEVFRLILFSDWAVYDPNAWELDFDELRATAGIGLGMLKPIPLTFHFGKPIRSFDTDEEQFFSFSISLR